MKILVSGMLVLFLAFSIQASAKEVIDTVKVLGNCGSCKSRIEKAAKQAGAAKANWNGETQTLKITYDEASTSLLTIEKGIASAGHDTRDVKANLNAYNKLESCCQYDRTGLSGAKECDEDKKEIKQ